jgi:hypothetical protein
MLKMTIQPNAEQILTLQAWARLHGRTWKQALGEAWSSGNYGGFAASPYLQQVRNNFGPSWLARFKLPAEAPPAHPADAYAGCTDEANARNANTRYFLGGDS